MSIKIVVSNTVRFKVKGTINDENGTPQPFDFWLTCKRLGEDEFKEKAESDAESTIADFLQDVIEGWTGVLDASGQALPYTPENLRALFRSVKGLARVAFQFYVVETGAKAKN